MPKLAYFPNKFTNAIPSLDPETWVDRHGREFDPVYATIEDLGEAMRRTHDSDAHFVCYSLRDGDEWPRIKKVCLPHIRKAGDDIVLPVLAIDIDREPHVAWSSPEEAQEFMALLEAYTEAGIPELRDWAHAYTTRKGARLVYELERPLSPEAWEKKVIQVVEALRKESFNADPACKDWTRMFRLPDGSRDGEQQGNQGWFALLSRDAKLEIGKLDLELPRGDDPPLDIKPVTSDKPDIEDCEQYLHTGTKQTEWYKNVKRLLKGEDYFGALFENQPLADPGGRDTSLLDVVGSVTGKLCGKYGTTPKHVYALILTAALGFEPDAGTPDWTESLWSKVCYVWARDMAKLEVQAKEQKQSEHRTASIAGNIIMGMAEWCNADELGVGPDGSIDTEAYDYMLRRLVAVQGREYYLMGLDGRYIPQTLTRETLVPKINQVYGTDGLIQTVVRTENSTRHVTPAEIVNSHGTVITKTVYKAARDEGGIISGMGSPFAALEMSPFARNPKLEPEFNADVDEWLHLLFGENYHAACKWLAWACAFEEGPICALSVKGPSGVGKTLLADGLAEVLRTPIASDFTEITGDWQYNLASSPFVFADEGLDEVFRKAHPADVFRRMIGRHQLQANRKGLAPVALHIDVRVLMTANNYSIIRALGSNREMTPEDREALMMRLLHFDLNEEAALWLAAKGGRGFTKGWVSDGRHSDFIVARHLLWLWSQRAAFGQDDRLLVEGNMNPTTMNELRLHSGAMDKVVQAIVGMVNAPFQSKKRGDTQIRDTQVFVVPADVHRYIQEELGHRNMRISQVRELLLSLLPAAATDADGKVKPLVIDGDRRRWYTVDVQFLLDTASQYGWRTTRLCSILEGQFNEDQKTDGSGTNLKLGGEEAV